MKAKLISTIMALTFIVSSFGTVTLADAGYTKANYKIERVDNSQKKPNGEVYYEIWYDKVVLTDDNEIARKINAEINAACEQFLAVDSDMLNSYNDVAHYATEPFYDKMSSEVTQSDNGILSIKLTQEHFVGQHYLIPFERAMSFNLRTGEKLRLTDVLSMNENEAKDYIKSCTYAHIDANPAAFNLNAKELAKDDLIEADFYVKNNSIFYCWGYNYLANAASPCTTVECPVIKIKVKLNGEYLVFDQPPQIINDRTMVPVRAIFEAMGYTVEWNGAEQTVYADHGTRSIQMTVGSKDMYLSGTKKTFDVAPINLSGRILVPARAVAELSGYMVDWDQENLTVDIYDWYYMNENK